MSNPSESEPNTRIRGLISGGIEIAGGAVGGALGFLAGGPVGAALLGAGGSAAALVLKHVGEEASERLLGAREKVRVGAVLAIAAADIRAKLENNQKPRQDGFFEKKSSGGRSDADEVAEGVLLKAQREPEEKKVRYMGFLLSNVAFAADISATMAHQIIKAAEQLAYRQLCILKLAVIKDDFSLRAADYRAHGQFAKELYPILYECLDLYHRGFISIGGDVAFGPTDIIPGKLTVQGLGADVFNIMRLAAIPDEDLIAIAAQLK